MKTLVIYDSVFGNTEQVALAIRRALPSQDDPRAVRVGDVDPDQLPGLELLIVGSPTRGFRPTEATAAFLTALPGHCLQGVKVAAFDTRFSLADIKSSAVRLVVRMGGYAAKAIADQLRRKGGEMIVPPEGFLVVGEQGPLKEGELDRAAIWARQVAESAKLAGHGS